MINKKICFSNRYIDPINKLLKTIMYNILYIYILCIVFYEDNNRILVIFSMCPRKN